MASTAPRHAIPAAPATVSFPRRLDDQAEGARKGERTRIALCVALCHALDQLAPTEVTVGALCDRAGVAHGTFYLYFPNRDALIGAVLVQFIGFLQAQMHQASRQSPADRMRAATGTYVALFEANRGLMKCLVNHLDGFPDARLAFQTLNHDWLTGVVNAVSRQWQQAGRVVDRDELLRRAYALGGMTDQYLTGLLLSNDPTLTKISTNRAAVIDTLTLLWQRGMDQ